MGLASLGLDIGVLCDFLYSVLLHVFSAIWGLDFSGLALSRPQVWRAVLLRVQHEGRPRQHGYVEDVHVREEFWLLPREPD